MARLSENQSVKLPPGFGKDDPIDLLARKANEREAAAHAVCEWLLEWQGDLEPELAILLEKWKDAAC